MLIIHIENTFQNLENKTNPAIRALNKDSITNKNNIVINVIGQLPTEAKLG